jgi:hypothetical protein
MKTIDFLNRFIHSPEFDKFLTYSSGYDSDSESFPMIHFVWETYLIESQIDFIEEPSQLHYVSDKANRILIGPRPLIAAEYAYAVFVSSLLMYSDPTVELSLAYTRAILLFQHPGVDLMDTYAELESTVKQFTD